MLVFCCELLKAPLLLLDEIRVAVAIGKFLNDLRCDELTVNMPDVWYSLPFELTFDVALSGMAMGFGLMVWRKNEGSLFSELLLFNNAWFDVLLFKNGELNAALAAANAASLLKSSLSILWL